jgi:hypothetical protein
MPETQFMPINDFGYIALNFGWVYKQDSGEYMCRATNKHGSTEVGATLVCTGKSGINYETQLPKEMTSLEQIHDMEMKVVTAYMPDREDDTERLKPCFMTKPEAVVITEGTTARFCCRVTGYPKPRVMWLINGQTIINVSVEPVVRPTLQCVCRAAGASWSSTECGTLRFPSVTKAARLRWGILYTALPCQVIARNQMGEAYATTSLKCRRRRDDFRSVLKDDRRE